MIFRWSLLALTLNPRPDILIIGTDPILSIVAARVWKLLRPRYKGRPLVLRRLSRGGNCGRRFA